MFCFGFIATCVLCVSAYPAGDSGGTGEQGTGIYFQWALPMAPSNQCHQSPSDTWSLLSRTASVSVSFLLFLHPYKILSSFSIVFNH